MTYRYTSNNASIIFAKDQNPPNDKDETSSILFLILNEDSFKNGEKATCAQHVFNGYDRLFSESLKPEQGDLEQIMARYPKKTQDFYHYMQNPDSNFYSLRPSKVGGNNGYVEMGEGLSSLELEKVSRRSKGLLESTLSSGGNIYFLLDDIDISQVVGKQDGPSGSNTVAANELRWLYRHREEVHQMPGNVIYLHDGKETKAPWESDPSMWSRYTPKRLLAGQHNWQKI